MARHLRALGLERPVTLPGFGPNSMTCTGERAQGNFMRSRLLVDSDPSLRVVIEEQFGPTIPIIEFREPHALGILKN